MMPRALDMLQCPKCRTFYVPEHTATGRLAPHCLELPVHVPPRTSELCSILRGVLINKEV